MPHARLRGGGRTRAQGAVRRAPLTARTPVARNLPHPLHIAGMPKKKHKSKKQTKSDMTAQEYIDKHGGAILAWLEANTAECACVERR